MAVASSNWKEIQKKTFTNWFNDRLRGNLKVAKVTVNDLQYDLADGLLLITLLENLAKPRKIARYNKKPTTKIMCIENLGLVLNFIKAENIKLVNIGPEDIYGCNLKLILGLIWTLIGHFQIRSSGRGLSTKQAMKEWLHTLIPDYNVQNFNTDWNDGRALCALVDRLKPGLCPNHASLSPSQGLQNCRHGMELAEETFEIPMILSPEDMNNPDVDDLSVMTYVSYFFQPASETLLAWVHAKIPKRNITNLSTDWNSGVNLGALMESCHTGLVPNWDEMDPHNARDNLDKCIKLAKDRLDIICPVGPDSLSDPKVDEIIVATYLSRFKYSKLLARGDELSLSQPDFTETGAGVVKEPVEIPIDLGDSPELALGHLCITAVGPSAEAVVTIEGTHDAKAKFTPLEAGVYKVACHINDEEITGSPLTVPVIDPLEWSLTEDPPEYLHVNKPREMLVKGTTHGSSPVVAVEVLDAQGFPAKHVMCSVWQLEPGTAQLTFSPSDTGPAEVSITVAGKDIQKSPFTVVVCNPDNCTVSGLDEDNVALLDEPIQFTVDAEGSGDVEPSVTIKGPSADYKPVLEETGDSSYSVSFNPTEAGPHAVAVTLGGAHVPGSPFTVSVLDTNKWKITSEIPEYLQVNSLLELTLEGPQVGDPPVEFTATDLTTDEEAETNIEKQKIGEYSLTVIATKVGKIEGRVTVADKEIVNSPFQIIICDATKCSVMDWDGSPAFVGETVSFTVDTTGAGDTVPLVKAKGPSLEYSPEVRDNKDGTHTFTFTPQEVGPIETSVTLGGAHIPGSPFTKPIENVSDPNVCSARGPGLSRAIAGRPARFGVITPESGLLKKRADALTVDIVSADRTTRVEATLEEVQDKAYGVTYTVPIEGEYLITIKVYGQPIPGCDFKVTAFPKPSPAKCRVYGPSVHPNAFLISGRPLELYVDANNAGYGELQTIVQGPKGTSPKIFMAEDDSVYSLRIDADLPGWYRINIWWAQVHIPDSPIDLKVNQAPNAGRVRAYGPGLEREIDAHKPADFFIETRDAGVGTLTVVVHGVKDAFDVDVKPENVIDPRKLKGTYYPREGGDYEVTVKWSGEDVPGSPFKVKVVDRKFEAQQEAEREREKERERARRRRERMRKQQSALAIMPGIVPPGMIGQTAGGGGIMLAPGNPTLMGMMETGGATKTKRTTTTEQQHMRRKRIVRSTSEATGLGQPRYRSSSQMTEDAAVKKTRKLQKSSTAPKSILMKKNSAPDFFQKPEPASRKLSKMRSLPIIDDERMARNASKMGVETPIGGKMAANWAKLYNVNEEDAPATSERRVSFSSDVNPSEDTSYRFQNEEDIPIETPVKYNPVYVVTGDIAMDAYDDEKTTSKKSKKKNKKK